MIGSFEFNGTESKSFDIVAKSVKRPVLPALKKRYSETSNKHGIIDHGGNKYSPRELKMHIAYIGDSYIDLRNRTREIAAWLNTDEWAKLIINDEPDKYYLARIYSEINLDTEYRRGEADITFLCQPFSYSLVDTAYSPTWEEADVPWLANMPWVMSESYQFTATEATDFIFNNPGTVNIGCDGPQKSKFDIEITGTWTTLSLALNGKTLTYTESGTGTLIIDNIEMEVTLDNTNKLDAIDGDLNSFLYIIPGQNTIQITGTDINVAVQLNFIPMWL